MEERAEGGRREQKRLEWSSHIEAWKSSGKSQAGYCREHGLNLKAFYYRKRRHTEKPLDRVRLVPVGVHPIAVHRERPETKPLLVHVGRLRVEVGPGFDAATLAMLVRTLERV